MWNLYPASKIISQRQKQRNYDLHQKKLGKMKSKIKILPPSQPEFVYTKNKLEMSRRDRQHQIDYQNQILLTKLQSISKAEYTANKLRPEAQHLKTLNQYVVQKQEEQIYNQNKRICQKLLRVNSYYPTLDIIDKTDDLERVKFNISQNARRAKSVVQLRPQSSQTYRSSKFYRSRVRNYDDGTPQQFKFYQLTSQSTHRPDSAPYPRQRRPFSSQKPKRSPIRNNENAEQEAL